MIRFIAAGLLAMSLATPALAAETAPPGGDYKKVSDLVKLPEFLPGLGPFLAYDHDGKLVSTIYMIPIKDITDHKKFEDLKATGDKVDHVDMYYNAGHPGVEEPHYHIVLWQVPKAEEARVAK